MVDVNKMNANKWSIHLDYLYCLIETVIDRLSQCIQNTFNSQIIKI